MKRGLVLALSLLMTVCFKPACQAAQTLVAPQVDVEPVIDGMDNDHVWKKAQAIVTHDNIADIDITLRAVHTDNKIFLLMSFPDPDESRLHKSWQWDPKKNIYILGADREDTFLVKWSMEGRSPVDLSIRADSPHRADIWYWKACRTDPVGYADDKMQIWGVDIEDRDATKVVSKSGKIMYLLRKGDYGKSAYKTDIVMDYKGEKVPRFTTRQPTSSRADVRAKGVWKDGGWTIEFARLLNTGNDDDIQFDRTKDFQFGVSRYEIAGREPDLEAEQPFHGVGDVSETLTLTFR